MRSAAFSVRYLLLFLFAFALLPGCDDPQAPAAPETDSTGNFDPDNGTMEFEIQSPSGGPTGLRLIARAVRVDAATGLVHAFVGIHNTGGEAVAGPDGILLSDFRPRDVEPVNAAECTERGCVYVYRGAYGPDGVLDPGEVSEMQEWILRNPSGQGFAFRVRLLSPQRSGVIAGVVFDDRNRNGHRDADEPGVAQREVTAQGPDGRHAAVTDESGRYVIEVTQAGLFHVAKTPHNSQIDPNPPPYQVVIVELPDGSLSSFRGADFACRQPGGFDGIPVLAVVYEDADRNGERSANESGLPGFLVSAWTLQCPTFAPIEGISNERGIVELKIPRCEPPYEVTLVVRDGFVPTTPILVHFDQPVEEGDVLRVEFGVVRAGASFVVAGHVFWDNDGNGLRDAGEEGIADIEIAVSPLLCARPDYATLVTDSTGGFKGVFHTDDPCQALLWLQRAPIAGTRDTTPNPVLVSAPSPNGSMDVIVNFGVQRFDP